MAGATTPASGPLVRVCLPPLLLLLFLYGCCRCGAVEGERTLALIKPDGLSGKYKEKIKAAILDSGFRIVKETEVQLDAERASLFYAEHSQRSFFDSLVKYITSGPVLAMVLERPDAIAQWRALIGPTDARKAKTSHPNRLKTNFFPLTCYGLEYIFYCITVFIVLFVVADSNICHCFFFKNLVIFVISALEQCVGWTQRKIACMVQIHRNLQPRRSHFSLEKLIL